MRKIGQNTVLSNDTLLGERVTIGNNVTFYPGVTVGDDCTILDGAVLGRPPLSTGNTSRPIIQTDQSLTIGDHSVIGANAVLYQGSSFGQHVMIGDLASVREGCVVRDYVVIGRAVLVMYDTMVDDRTRVIDGAILTGNMIIEADVFIGPGVRSINDNDVYLKRFGLQPFSAKGPVIRRFALIGAGANLAAEIEIGVGAVVAPSAMVTRSVPPWTIVGGVPAQILRLVKREDQQAILEKFGLPVDFGVTV